MMGRKCDRTIDWTNGIETMQRLRKEGGKTGQKTRGGRTKEGKDQHDLVNRGKDLLHPC